MSPSRLRGGRSTVRLQMVWRVDLEAHHLALKVSNACLRGLQVTCDPNSNCKGPCTACNTSKDTCEPATFTGTCSTATGATGRCEAGECKARWPQCSLHVESRTRVATLNTRTSLILPSCGVRVSSIASNLHCIYANPQVTCNSTTCPGPCRRCNTAIDACEAASFNGTCTTSDQSVGRCEGGVCKVGLTQSVAPFVLDGRYSPTSYSKAHVRKQVCICIWIEGQAVTLRTMSLHAGELQLQQLPWSMPPVQHFNRHMRSGQL